MCAAKLRRHGGPGMPRDSVRPKVRRIIPKSYAAGYLKAGKPVEKTAV
ncbi:hypothetical protein HMPREF9371_0990 [Neisseria shayeganii 871]|uniref:Uncharacterized protein n=1 Tax=Neisseria shayeganii 871 TaxID=1032488 RepID=G4CHA1_9NEIS|nr:hypothetical protein HMPREF9371_0990 [Neisseria shayeganii 871]